MKTRWLALVRSFALVLFVPAIAAAGNVAPGPQPPSPGGGRCEIVSRFHRGCLPPPRVEPCSAGAPGIRCIGPQPPAPTSGRKH